MVKPTETIMEFKPEAGPSFMLGSACAVGGLISATIVARHNLIIGAVLSILGAFGAIVLFAAPFSQKLVLRLSPEGLKYGTFRRTHFFPWSAFEKFGVIDLGGKRTCFLLKAGARFGDKVAASNRASIGCDRFLPATYGKSAADLAELLETWRRRHAAG